MTSLFLKAKHWHLFGLTFGIPFLLQIILMGTILWGFSRDGHANPTVLNNIAVLYVIQIFVLLFIVFGWLWSVSIGLQKNIPDNILMKVNKFKMLFLVPVIFIMLLTIFIGFAIRGMQTLDPDSNFDHMMWVFPIIFPLHLFSMFGIFYTFYFTAKTLKTVELQREVSFSDFAGEFFMIWFFPIGIWILQPRINQLVENDEELI